MQVQLIIVPYEVERSEGPVARAPFELLDLGLAERLTEAGYDVRRTDLWHRAGDSREAIVASVARETARAVALAESRGRFPLVLSGGCLTAVGVVDGLQRVGEEVQVVWVDAHGDFNTPETTPSGYLDGMALAAVCGRSLGQIFEPIDPRTVPCCSLVHIGGRDFDPPELEDFERLNVTLIGPRQVGSEKAQSALRGQLDPGRSTYLHLDLDGLDPSEAPAVHFPVDGGVRVDGLLELLGVLGPPAALTLAGLDFGSADAAARRTTFATCMRLVEAVLTRARAARQPTAS